MSRHQSLTQSSKLRDNALVECGGFDLLRLRRAPFADHGTFFRDMHVLNTGGKLLMCARVDAHKSGEGQ